MISSLQRILFIIAASLIAVDLVWAIAGGFQIDVMAYARLGLLSIGLVGAGIFYQIRRAEPRIAAMLVGAAFLCSFSAAASALNYFLLTAHGPRIDAALVAADRALGFNWVDAMTAMADYPLFNRVLFFAYNIVLPEIALMTVILGWSGNAEKTYRFCTAVAVGALIAIFIWALIPSVGTQALFTLPPDVAAKLNLAVDADYGATLNQLLRDGPGYISPSEVRGLIAFPSYHGVLALIVTWYARSVPRLFWPLAVINALVLVATPIHGGHHLVDVLAAFPVTALALLLAGEFKAISLKSSMLVNKVRNFADRPVPQGVSRAVAAQLYANAASIIKSKLSRVA